MPTSSVSRLAREHTYARLSLKSTRSRNRISRSWDGVLVPISTPAIALVVIRHLTGLQIPLRETPRGVRHYRRGRADVARRRGPA